LDDIQRLDQRTLSLQRHFGQVENDLEQIEEAQLAEDEALDPPAVATEGHVATVVDLSKHSTRDNIFYRYGKTVTNLNILYRYDI